MKNEDIKKEILNLSKEYIKNQTNNAIQFTEGERIPYAGRIYDEEEVCNLVDAALDFWLTSGKYTKQFEKELADYLGIKYCSFVNSGSFANLLAFMALTSPLLGDRVLSLEMR